MKKINLLNFTMRKGIPYINSINREHELYKSFEPWKKEAGMYYNINLEQHLQQNQNQHLIN